MIVFLDHNLKMTPRNINQAVSDQNMPRDIYLNAFQACFWVESIDSVSERGIRENLGGPKITAGC